MFAMKSIRELRRHWTFAGDDGKYSPPFKFRYHGPSWMLSNLSLTLEELLCYT